jgi:hypothetical protein
MLISKLAQKCFSIFASAVVCFFVCHPVRDLLLPLSVPAVILSEAKDPEELNEPKPSIPSNPYHSAPVFSQKPSSRPKTAYRAARVEDPHFTSLLKFLV